METTKNQFKHFCRCLLKWQNKLKLEDWKISVNHKDDELKCVSSSIYDYESLLANIQMAKTWDIIQYTPRLADISAYHEMLHLLFSPLLELFDETGDKTLKSIAEKEEHRIIAILERDKFGYTKNEGRAMET